MEIPIFGTKTKSFWATLLVAEVVIIFISNILAIKVFLKMRSTPAVSPKSTYLLINLTIADVLVGISAMFNFIEVVEYNEFLFLPCRGIIINEISLTFTVFTTFASLVSLALIALERMLAIFVPFHFRNASKKHYIFAIIVSWCLSVPYLVMRNITDCKNKIRILYFTIIISTAIITIIISYTAIFIKIKFFSTMQPSVTLRHSIKLSKTMQLATLLAVITWLPRFIAGRFGLAGKGVLLANVYMGCVVLMYTNSFLNVLIYTLRMPHFRRELKNMCKCEVRSTNGVGQTSRQASTIEQEECV